MEMGDRMATTIPHLLSASASTCVIVTSSPQIDLAAAQGSWESPGFIRGHGCKFYYVLLDFMSIHLLSLIYFANDRVCYMQRDFALSSWADPGDVATNFRAWFNYVANKRWSDNKNRSLRFTFDMLGKSAIGSGSYCHSTFC